MPEDLPKLIEHCLLTPELTGEDVIAGCRLAGEYQVAAVVVRPCDIELAARELRASGVRVASVAGFPHGSSTTAVKLYEVRDALRRGAREIDAAVNLGALRSRQFPYVETELLQMADTCHKEGALLKVILDTAWLTDELKIVACRISVRAGVDFACAQTVDDLRLMRTHLPENVGLKAADVSTLDEARAALAAGATRLGSTATSEILSGAASEAARGS